MLPSPTTWERLLLLGYAAVESIIKCATPCCQSNSSFQKIVTKTIKISRFRSTLLIKTIFISWGVVFSADNTGQLPGMIIPCWYVEVCLISLYTAWVHKAPHHTQNRLMSSLYYHLLVTLMSKILRKTWSRCMNLISIEFTINLKDSTKWKKWNNSVCLPKPLQ